MKTFDKIFFGRFIPDEEEIRGIVHGHWILVFRNLLLTCTFGVVLPVLFYVWSPRIRDFVSFIHFEYFLILIFIKIVYDLFNWYSDVWILSDNAVYDIEWSFIRTNVSSINYDNIEGMQIDQNGLLDKILGKGVVIIHKIGNDSFALPDAVIPYEAIESIQEKIQGEEDDDDSHITSDRFEKILDVLAGVVDNYLVNNTENDKAPELDPVKSIKVKKHLPPDDEYTIDMR